MNRKEKKIKSQQPLLSCKRRSSFSYYFFLLLLVANHESVIQQFCYGSGSWPDPYLEFISPKWSTTKTYMLISFHILPHRTFSILACMLEKSHFFLNHMYFLWEICNRIRLLYNISLTKTILYQLIYAVDGSLIKRLEYDL